MWEDTSKEGYPGNEHGIFEGHFHNNTEALMSLLDLALATNDGWLKQFVREGYAHARRSGVLRMGWFPAWTMPERFNRPAWLHGITEPCGVGDMAVLAVKLTDAGLGEYWDDVDYIVRNHLSAQQIIDLEGMRKIGGGTAQHELPASAIPRRFCRRQSDCHSETMTSPGAARLMGLRDSITPGTALLASVGELPRSICS